MSVLKVHTNTKQSQKQKKYNACMITIEEKRRRVTLQTIDKP